MSTESTALAIRDPQALATPHSRRVMRPPLAFSSDERQIIRDSFMPGSSEAEAKAMIAVAEHMRLDPFKKQIHFVQRWNKELGRMVWAHQIAIDGYRSNAEDTGEFCGSDEPEFTFEDRIDPESGEPTGKRELVARVKVYRKDFDKPFIGVARYTEFVQTTKEGRANSMWARAPKNMLAKCAEAQALRKAFPQDLPGDDEIPDERDVTPPSVVRGDVRSLQSLQAAPIDAEVVEKKDWPAAFRAAADESALGTTLGAYQKVKEKLTTAERKDAQAAFKERKGALEEAARKAEQKEPEHDPATGEVVPPAEGERTPGEEG